MVIDLNDTYRMAFKIGCKMVKEIPANFKNKFWTKGNKSERGLECKYCQEKVLLDQAHCVMCVSCEDIRQGLYMTSMLDLVKFFQEMMKMIDKKKEKVDQSSEKPK